MNAAIQFIWAYEVRLVPILAALSIFTLLHFLRRVTKVEYTPSYFALFPLSTIEYQLSDYFDEFWSGEYKSIQKGRKPNTPLYIRSWVSFFLTFLIVPLICGLTVSFLLRTHEFHAYMILLLAYEGWHCVRAIYDFHLYRGEWRSVLKFFVPFYGTYLISLFLVIRSGYFFARPLIERGEYQNLLLAIESIAAPLLIQGIIIGVITNLLAHWLVNKDAIKPSEESLTEERDYDD